jgi:predicted TIM-barrel fold metal-dependent hydrolase
MLGNRANVELPMKVLVFSGILAAGMVALGQQPQHQAISGDLQAPVSGVSTGATAQGLRAFAAIEPIDTHAHVRRSDPAFNAMLDRLNLHLLDIILVNDQSPGQRDLASERSEALEFIRSSGGRAVLCTSIDPYKMHDPGFAGHAIRELNQDFKQGAIAVKIWKNIGMEIKDADGHYVLPDDPAFAPIYRDIAAHNKTLVAHVADPDSAWAPPDPTSPDYSYYQENPFWYMYGKTDPASKRQILKARDHILEQNPGLRVVGAHLGSMESDFPLLAQHLDRYPNFAVDMAARMAYLAKLPRADAIAFIMKYQDRLIYGTDLTFGANDQVQKKIDTWEQTYARDWAFLATTDTVVVEGTTAKGLALPEDVLRKILHDNAIHWFPGILGNAH